MNYNMQNTDANDRLTPYALLEHRHGVLETRDIYICIQISLVFEFAFDK